MSDKLQYYITRLEDELVQREAELETVRAENARLREALKQIASGQLFQHAHEFARAALAEQGEK